MWIVSNVHKKLIIYSIVEYLSLKIVRIKFARCQRNMLRISFLPWEKNACDDDDVC